MGPSFGGPCSAYNTHCERDTVKKQTQVLTSGLTFCWGRDSERVLQCWAGVNPVRAERAGQCCILRVTGPGGGIRVIGEGISGDLPFCRALGKESWETGPGRGKATAKTLRKDMCKEQPGIRMSGDLGSTLNQHCPPHPCPASLLFGCRPVSSCKIGPDKLVRALEPLRWCSCYRGTLPGELCMYTWTQLMLLSLKEGPESLPIPSPTLSRSC